MGKKSRQKQARVSDVEKSDTSWKLDWSFVDRSGPFPWPASNDSIFYLLAGYLAKLNELSFFEVTSLERPRGNSPAVHLLTEMSDEAESQWSKLYEQRALDSPGRPFLELYTMTYCISQMDARRVVIAFDAQDRVGYPLWWDPKHDVSGSNRDNEPDNCSSEKCHHLPDVIRHFLP